MRKEGRSITVDRTPLRFRAQLNGCCRRSISYEEGGQIHRMKCDGGTIDRARTIKKLQTGSGLLWLPHLRNWINVDIASCDTVCRVTLWPMPTMITAPAVVPGWLLVTMWSLRSLSRGEPKPRCSLVAFDAAGDRDRWRISVWDAGVCSRGNEVRSLGRGASGMRTFRRMQSELCLKSLCRTTEFRDCLQKTIDRNNAVVHVCRSQLPRSP